MELITARLRLREQTEADAEAANVYERDPEVVRFQTSEPRTLEESRSYIRRVLAESSVAPRRLFDLGISLLDSGAFIGRAGLYVKDPEQRDAAIWWVLNPAHQGQGYASEAMRALITFGFRELGLHRVHADIDPRNVASVRVAKRLGMRREAHFRENYWCKGEWTDSLIFGLLEREWPRGP